ncbi:hypothetical protein [Amycolatopsis jiangsuensis]|uniref:Uncharacterized protein n=1 Tax=Amycolatopsis jiangsuensis TaxID=1181879 RepID=A0A840IZ88_9PSEU|nr:hypothetical protein [Amycolatopsis jiangsuensis]MBB4686829.1 hypothetical protein [Amycolatopsis jiangsuensis]
MNTRPLLLVLSVVLAGFFVVCLVFLLHELHVPYPAAVGSWLDGHDWLKWTAAAGTVLSAVSIAPLTMLVDRR